MDNMAKIENVSSFGDVFELVKEAVREVLGLRRAGLSLILADLPRNIGAMHAIGTNSIVMNRLLVSTVSKIAKSRVEFNSFVFVLLLHEYLHSLGYTDEMEVRKLVKRVTEGYLGKDHVAYKIASRPLSEIYPEIRYLPSRWFGQDLELVKDFDRSSITYIS